MVGHIIQFDHSLSLWVVSHRVDLLNPLMWGLSASGRGGIVWLIAGAILTVARRMRPSSLVQLAAAILLASLVTDHVLKPRIGRQRPFVRTSEIRVIGGAPHDASLPSGHSANAFAGAYVLAGTVPAMRVACWTMALLIALSRVYLGVHYPLDVMAGAIVGLLSGVVVLRWIKIESLGTGKSP